MVGITARLTRIPRRTSLFCNVAQTVAPQLPEYLQQCFLDALEKDRLRSMPNSYLPAAPVTRKGVIVLGDALNMR